jgi:hypothetical protein
MRVLLHATAGTEKSTFLFFLKYIVMMNEIDCCHTIINK